MNILKQIYYKIKCKLITNKYADYKREKYEDRNVLENIIFPYVLANFNLKTVLDIGREDYQEFYNQFFKNQELWTLDYNPEHQEFGAPRRHIIDDAGNVKKHWQDNYFDLIILNGVIGWGLNDIEKIEKALSGIIDILKPGGLLIIGWNNFKDVEVVNPDSIKALGRLKPFVFPPLKTCKFECVNGNHTYNFYKKI
ncbi:MAG: hypothetical protein US83_C0013G0018 [Candidatus Falkowbacteria bacterium GW2011_GWC2_38_22]|uniref:Methyltransferase type 11 domain-containing protein n=1 Tax=Candidatus Falkowbacteria bacterium GW2011_GWE1_38_31 TaxID=1618638 RepID=A0A0G0MW05_9BACT|nr:MAG: hypothetical protein US73_C0018G0006 [Candidatus Falkowbacteria bacterium GW2011_GWF2_38_1205]KKQ60728.1 MAG: hypothetical protein US83_C0013G0018 [Candidatus Falkowbacteria bacterium GW2011_GWC2_38_22]KKQ62411.1 MAG: hypothetical protein US84_C0017G0009 [Candidatus Falkowbacteria bacterium GW2011_GWF1_38_22]KKQ64466.1 MAG: hypothetical protein US87_C0017G0009 [Candidatus Falkowbacteria bacterium GW2011_GWE2_38_254]KKQ69101.1 MAG: hypothetical protein US91_C0016G0009 [Candidatus Falkowb